jgi:hypothetical protein
MNMQPATARPTWQEYLDWLHRIGDPTLQAAVALLGVDPSGVVRLDAEHWLHYQASGRDAAGGWVPDPGMDWQAWVVEVCRRGRGWSSTEWRLFDVVAGLATNRPFSLVGVLDRMGSWEAEVWRVLIEWGTGGDNAPLPGRSTARRRPNRVDDLQAWLEAAATPGSPDRGGTAAAEM